MPCDSTVGHHFESRFKSRRTAGVSEELRGRSSSWRCTTRAGSCTSAGSGPASRMARSLRDQLERLKRPTSPFPNKLPADAVRGVRWVEPKLVAEVELRGWTSDGLLRHASYKGLREDKDPSEVVRETRSRGGEPQGRRQAFELTHPDRLLWPDVGLTKQGLAEFYADCRLGAAAPNRATVVPGAVPVRDRKQMLLPEARMGGHGRIGQAAGHR